MVVGLVVIVGLVGHVGLASYILKTIGIHRCTFDVVIVSVTTKPYILQKILNQ